MSAPSHVGTLTCIGTLTCRHPHMSAPSCVGTLTPHTLTCRHPHPTHPHVSAPSCTSRHPAHALSCVTAAHTVLCTHVQILQEIYRLNSAGDKLKQFIDMFLVVILEKSPVLLQDMPRSLGQYNTGVRPHVLATASKSDVSG